MHSTDDSSDSDTTETGRPAQPQTFRERHALKILGAIMLIMFGTVIAVQVAC